VWTTQHLICDQLRHTQRPGGFDSEQIRFLNILSWAIPSWVGVHERIASFSAGGEGAFLFSALIVLRDFSHRQLYPHYVSKKDEPTLLAEATLRCMGIPWPAPARDGLGGWRWGGSIRRRLDGEDRGIGP
jgi:hypothetical protein